MKGNYSDKTIKGSVEPPMGTRPAGKQQQVHWWEHWQRVIWYGAIRLKC